MPQKINMIISNGFPTRKLLHVNPASLGFAPSFTPPYAGPIETPSLSSTKASSSLRSPFIARVHNVRPGCGSCGKH